MIDTHRYLARIAAGRPANRIGVGLAILYVATGSIGLPILAHIALDVLQGLVAFEIMLASDDGAEDPDGALSRSPS